VLSIDPVTAPPRRSLWSRARGSAAYRRLHRWWRMAVRWFKHGPGRVAYEGWALARPMSADDFVIWLAQQRAAESGDLVVLHPAAEGADTVRELPTQRSRSAAATPRAGRARRGGR